MGNLKKYDIILPILGINYSKKVSNIIKAFIQKMVGKRRTKIKSTENIRSANIIQRTEHCISRANISPNALKVLYRLHEAGYAAYLVGGSVRDLLLNLKPKDFDIATDAHPEQVKSLFRNCILIGKRFRLAHIRYGREIVEVATFRASQDIDHSDHVKTEQGLILRDNVYGTLPEDAFRRDFSVNALYYNIADFSVIDYCEGMNDLQHKILRLIGDPLKRYHEDPVRLIRAIRLAGKLGFTIDHQTAAPIISLAHLLHQVSPARLYEETLKLFLCGNAVAVFKLLHQYHLFGTLFPETNKLLHTENEFKLAATLFIDTALKNTDIRLAESKHVTPIFLFAVLLWYPLQQSLKELKKIDTFIMDRTAEKIIAQQVKHTAIPRRISAGAREIWTLQLRFKKPQLRSVNRLLSHQRFRAAYDFLLLRAIAEPSLNELAQWWSTIQTVDESIRENMVKEWQEKTKKPMRKRKK